MKRSRERPITREVDAPEAVHDEATRPVHGSLEEMLQFEALRRHSAEEHQEEEEPPKSRRPNERKTAKVNVEK
jgi:hypothetical protein